MALFARLKDVTLSGRCIKFVFVPNSSFHWLSRTAKDPPAGSRSFFNLFRRPTQRKLKEADDVPDAFELIYRNTMSRYIFGAQVTSILAGGLVIGTFIYRSQYQNYASGPLVWSPESRSTDDQELFYITFLVIFLTMMQVMVSRFPLRIYKVPRTPKYVMINYGNYFFGKKKFTFQRGQIFQMEESGILPWRDSRYVVESQNERKRLILLETFFRRPGDLSIMLGEQKDPELEE